MTALGAPAHLFAYAEDSSGAAEAAQTQSQADSEASATPAAQNDQEELEKKGKTSIADAVRTASASSGVVGSDANSIPYTSVIALGLAAFALIAVALKLKA